MNLRSGPTARSFSRGDPSDSGFHILVHGRVGVYIYDEDGNVRGVIVAESARRGRIYTASPEAVAEFIKATGADTMGQQPRSFSTETYGREADYARRNLQVVKVACSVEE